jgi:putative FmdB family regulatory protein
MPIYEYICNACLKKTSILVRFPSVGASPSCPHCQASALTRIISPFAIHKAVGSIHEDSFTANGEKSPGYYNDPRNVGRDLEQKLKGMNMEVPSEIQNSINEARQGKLPDALKDLESASADSAYH